MISADMMLKSLNDLKDHDMDNQMLVTRLLSTIAGIAKMALEGTVENDDAKIEYVGTVISTLIMTHLYDDDMVRMLVNAVSTYCEMEGYPESVLVKTLDNIDKHSEAIHDYLGEKYVMFKAETAKKAPAAVLDAVKAAMEQKGGDTDGN